MNKKQLIHLILLTTPGTFAQPTVGPTNESLGAPRGQNVSSYNIMNSFETGYRFRSVGGDLGKYRSDVNFGNGIRLLGSTLSINSREGKGHLFDEILLTTQGLGNDPYQSSTLRVQKNKLYRYDLLWRSNEYNNQAAAIALGRHSMNTIRLLQDHDFTLFPQSNFQIFGGFSRNTQTGPALTTTNIGNHTGDEFTLFDNVRRQQTQYRLGGQVKLAGIKLNVLRGWENFKEDTPFDFLAGAGAGANTTDQNTLTSYRKREPYHGNSPFWRVSLFREQGEFWAVNGRFTYTAGNRNFISDESLLGGTRFGALNRQIITFGEARRPVATGNLTFSLFPSSRVTFTNHTAISNVRMDGDVNYRELSDGELQLEQFSFQYLGIRTVSNATDASIQATKWLGFVAGYQFTDRRIRSVESASFFGGDPETERTEQTNRVHSGRLGIRIRPNKPLSITLDSEVGRADQPIYPTSDRNYHILGGRVQYKAKSYMLAIFTRTNYNFNSTNITSFSSRNRNYGADGSWTVNPSLTFNAGYTKLHTDTLSGIAFFATQRLQRGLYAYLSNVHSAYVNAHVSIRRRVDLLAGLSRVEDTGDGTDRNGGPLYQATDRPFFYSAETFPMAFTSPMGRVSVKLHNKVRWNLAYQYYGYRQDFASRIIPSQGYRAHTGYTSISWAF
jgi:hypothetical protein